MLSAREAGPRAAAVGWLAPPGFPSWDDYWREVGVPEEELGGGPDRIRDPDGHGPRIWFQAVPEGKTIKNRIHLDINASGGRTVPIDVRKQRAETDVCGNKYPVQDSTVYYDGDL
jgi:hypothetical protein